MDEVQVGERPQQSAHMMDTDTKRDMGTGQRASVSASSLPPFGSFFISLSIITNQQDNARLFFFLLLFQNNMIQTPEKLISLSK